MSHRITCTVVTWASVVVLACLATACAKEKDNDADSDTDTSVDSNVEPDTTADTPADTPEDTAGDPDAVEDPDADPDAAGDPDADADAEADAEADAVDPHCVPRTGSLTFRGVDADHEGCAAWNTVAGAPEPAAQGHDIDWAPLCVIYAYYYIASRDHVDSTATAGLHVTGATDGFASFQAALATAGFTLADVKATWTVLDLGADTSGTEWSYDAGTTVETRHYTSGTATLTLTLDGEPMVGGPMPELTVFADYNDVSDCFDDQISGTTPALLLEDASSGSSAGVQAAAAAFLMDVGGFGVVVTFDSIQPVGITEFTSDNRTGAYMEGESGTIEIGDTIIDPACE